MVSRLHRHDRPTTRQRYCQTLGVSKGFVRQVIQHYNRYGEDALATPGKGGRHNCDLSWSQEKQLIESFKTKAIKGYIATAKEIKLAYEQQVGHQVHKTTIYRFIA